MKSNRMALCISLTASLAILGCDDTTEATADPLADTWANSECFGMSAKPADIESCSTELVFNDDLEVELRAEWVSLAATAENPGCTTTKIVTGQTWSTDHDAGTFTISGDGVATMERTNCVNDADNLDAAETNTISLPGGKAGYSIVDDTLTVESGDLSGTYAR